MSDDRRYGDAEIRKIFESSGSTNSPGDRPDVSSEGLTLAELQVIAQEVGLSPTRVSELAATLDHPSPPHGRNSLGMPVSVSRTVPLARLPTDREWELILADLRSTFGVLGEAASNGNIREWTGDRHFAAIEPTEGGCRIRLGSSRPLAVLGNGAGLAWIGAAAITLLTLLRTGDLAGANALIAPIMGTIRVSTILYNGRRLEKWADRCSAQFDYIVAHARSITGGDAAVPPPAGEVTTLRPKTDEWQRPLS